MSNELSPEIYTMLKQAKAAQAMYGSASQKQADSAVYLAARAMWENARHLARLAVDETGMGVWQDKELKNQSKAALLWNNLKNQPSVGIIKQLPAEGLAEVAHPMGVIAAMTPSTNPAITVAHNIMLALKGRNSIIICPHPNATETGIQTVACISQKLASLNLPANLVQIVQQPRRETVKFLASNADVSIVTGGNRMVKTVYSCGKPAYGAGAGNIQCLVDEDISNFDEVAAMVVRGRSFDNGILCTSEQSLLYPQSIQSTLLEHLQANGAAYINSPAQVNTLLDLIKNGEGYHAGCNGTSALSLAAKANIPVPGNTKILMLHGVYQGRELGLRAEKLFPVLGLFPCTSWEHMLREAENNLRQVGTGHSAIIHSGNQSRIEEAAIRLPVSRLAVNQCGALSLGGALYNSLTPTSTLCCGTWGNNSISENLSFRHLINISRIAYKLENTNQTLESLWNE